MLFNHFSFITLYEEKTHGKDTHSNAHKILIMINPLFKSPHHPWVPKVLVCLYTYIT